MELTEILIPRGISSSLIEQVVDRAVVSVDLWLDDPSDSVNLAVVVTFCCAVSEARLDPAVVVPLSLVQSQKFNLSSNSVDPAVVPLSCKLDIPTALPHVHLPGWLYSPTV